MIQEPTDAAIAHAAELLRAGGLVAFPTETVYGLGADAASPAAVARLYEVKGRPVDHPVIVHLGAPASIHEWAADVPDAAARLAEACWPGPLTLVLPRAPHVADAITGGLDTIALRVPDQPVARALLVAFGGGVAAPSANRFGRVSPTTAADVVADLGDALRPGVDGVLDGGPCRVGVESTIVDCARLDHPGARPAILRVGGISRERVEAVLGYAVDARTGGETRAPGTLASHYAPNARVVVVTDEQLSDRAAQEIAAGRRVGVLASKLPDFLDDAAVVVGTPADADEYARTLYRCLRDADARALDVVLAVVPAEVGIGAAVADRLRRAAGAGS